MEDQGIMTLPMGGMQAPTAQPAAPAFDPAASAAFEQARQQIDPREFGTEILNAAEQTDPVAVREFRRAIESMNLPPEIIDALGQMVDAILAEPQNYPQIREEFIKEGVPAELLPEQFDPAYFGAMNMALDQMSGMQQPMGVQRFAEGGIATLSPIAAGLAQYGRNGDSIVAHITPAEARMLRRYGGSGTINPVTGLPEFFLKKVAKAVGNAFKSVGNAISSAVKSVGSAVKKFASSTVGKVVTSVALGFFLGPAAASFLGVTSAAGVAAVSGFVGGFGSSLLAGQSVKDALKSGAIGGLSAGAISGVTGGLNAFESGSYAGPTTVAGQWERAVEGGKSLLGMQSAQIEPVGQLSYSGTGEVLPGTSAPTVPTTAELATTPVAPPAPTTVTPIPAGAQGPLNAIDQLDLATGQAPAIGAPVAPPAPAVTPAAPASQGIGALSRPTAFDALTESDIYAGTAPPIQGPVRTFGTPAAPGAAPGAAATGFQQAPSAMDYFRQGEYFQGAKEAFMPTSYTDAQLVNSPAFQTARGAGATYSEALKAAQNTYNPGMFRTYGPMVAAGVGALGASGAFTPKEEPPPGIVPKETGTDLLRREPGVYGTTPGGAQISYYTPPYMGYGLTTREFMRPMFYFGTPQYRTGFAEGGIASLAKGGTAKFPRKTGAIDGPGTATSDSIPAMLSDGEFVFTAKAVRGMGKGSRRLGAKRMYALMKALEGKA